MPKISLHLIKWEENYVEFSISRPHKSSEEKQIIRASIHHQPEKFSKIFCRRPKSVPIKEIEREMPWKKECGSTGSLSIPEKYFPGGTNNSQNFLHTWEVRRKISKSWGKFSNSRPHKISEERCRVLQADRTTWFPQNWLIRWNFGFYKKVFQSFRARVPIKEVKTKNIFQKSTSSFQVRVHIKEVRDL